MIKKEKVVLAYSGGLDTSCILKWLIDKGYDVIAMIADLGQMEDFTAAKSKALKIGAKKVYIIDCKKEFVTDYILPAIQGNAVYEGRYLLGTSLARPLIAKKQIEVAKKEDAHYVSHGATGKGNDQVRFELSYYALNPKIKVIAPWKVKEFLDKFKGRTDLLNYAEQNGIPVTATKAKPYSTDENLMHISYESGILEDPNLTPESDMCKWTKDPKDAPDKETEIKIYFKNGLPVKVEDLTNNVTEKKPLELYLYLNKIGAENAVGRIDIVENRFVGIKSRGVYETPAGTILHVAHMDIEGIAMDREVLKLRNMLSPKFAELIYNGFWFSPEMDFLMAAIKKSQEAIDGTVKLKLYKGNVIILGRESPSSLYNKDLSSMDIEGGYNQEDAEGFIKINAIRLAAHNAIMKQFK
ncbi:argininosuccinate synthase [Candidatus Woesearchaeota archaeon CG10_big_fil_rev_8_21_14_0_10_34_8]|nr:MAG: argininosuccinate synthase [Candidatus Woesearchaeota archaeon CG10_big_fil_rev_8_21_14_0_10_34_8]